MNCVICQDGGKDIGMVTVGEKGLGTLLEYCKRRGGHNLEGYLLSQHGKTKQVKVHETCRRDLTNPLRLGHASRALIQG